MQSKLKKLIWPILYMILTIFICCSGCMIFHSYYYRSIFVDGDSMYPTLKGGTSTTDGISYFGIINAHEYALKKIQRFNIITTYYPWDDKDYDQSTEYESGTGRTARVSAYYKIKRIVCLPGDIFYIKHAELYLMDKENPIYSLIYGKTQEEMNEIASSYEGGWEKYQEDLDASFVKVDFPYERRFGKNEYIKDVGITQLHKDEEDSNKDEYWALGDNWGNSTDCGTLKKPVYKENLVGVLVAIEGTCKIRNGTGGNNERTCEDREYFAPIFF